MRTFRVAIEQEVLVTIDEAKFDETFMAEFRKSFYPFKTLEDHVQHIAQLAARGLAEGSFIEGYGKVAEIGIVTETDERENFEVGDAMLVETNGMHASLIDMRRKLSVDSSTSPPAKR